MNLLDAAIQVAEEGTFDRRHQPSDSEMKRAVGLVQKVVLGTATNSDRIILDNLLSSIGTSFGQVYAAMTES